MELTVLDNLTGARGGLPNLSAGAPQRSGALTVVPLLGPDPAPRVAPPSVGARLAAVHAYGDASLKNDSGALGIAPLHLGYIQHGAQNHALCRAALIPAGKTVRFDDACCVQAAQGGFLEGKAQWFFLLPWELRAEALALRGKKGYGKLWDAIGRFNSAYGLKSRGHLDELLVKQRGRLAPLQSRFERLDGQIGALFFLGERLVGVEIAPSAAYFAEIWPALVCFVYGPAAWKTERSEKSPDALPFEAEDLAELSVALRASRRERDRNLTESLASGVNQRAPKPTVEERREGFALATVEGAKFAGQTVECGGRVVYASLFAV